MTRDFAAEARDEQALAERVAALFGLPPDLVLFGQRASLLRRLERRLFGLYVRRLGQETYDRMWRRIVEEVERETPRHRHAYKFNLGTLCVCGRSRR